VSRVTHNEALDSVDEKNGANFENGSLVGKWFTDARGTILKFRERSRNGFRMVSVFFDDHGTLFPRGAILSYGRCQC
jgi:hypothetical protein